MTNMNSGYVGFSMSINAREAYQNNEMPISKWTKAVMLESINEIAEAHKMELPANFIKLTAAELRENFLQYSGYHHTSKYANRTEFYNIDVREVLKMTEESITAILSERLTKKTEKDPGQLAKCSYLVWSGSRHYPKAHRYTDIGTIRGDWFYLPDGSKKKVSANGFEILEYLN